MRISRPFLCVMIAITALLSMLPSIAQADTYQILRLANDDYSFIYGIYGSGAVVLGSNFSFGGCTTITSGSCYITYVNGLAFSGSSTPPTITDDGGPTGSGCPALPSFLSPSDITFDICNNGHEAYGANYRESNLGFITNGVFDGPDMANDYIGGFIASSQVEMNSYGDLVWNDVGDEEIIEAYDVTSHLSQVPEPGSWTLIGIGTLAAAIFWRKRGFLHGTAHFNS